MSESAFMSAPLHAPALRASSGYSACLQGVARFGYAAKGVVYLLVGYIAARAAFAAGSPTDSAGALQELLHDGGRWTVLVVAFGLAAHAAWLLVQAIRDPEHRDKNAARRVFFLVASAIHASLAFTALKVWQGQVDSGGWDGSEKLAAQLLARPFGEALVALVGLCVIGYALQQFVVAFRGDIARRLNVVDPDGHRALVVIGRAGIAARAVVFGILGTFFIEAARRHDPGAAGGMGEVLRSFGHGWLLATVAIGLIAYGVFELANAAYRRIPVR